MGEKFGSVVGKSGDVDVGFLCGNGARANGDDMGLS